MGGFLVITAFHPALSCVVVDAVVEVRVGVGL